MAGHALDFIIGIFFLLPAILFWLVRSTSRSSTWIETTGQVSALEFRSGVVRRPGGEFEPDFEGHLHWVELSYSYQVGLQRYSGQVRLEESAELEGLELYRYIYKPGQKFPLCYAGDAPQRSQLGAPPVETPWTDSIGAYLLIFGSIFIGLLFIFGVLHVPENSGSYDLGY